MKNTKEKKQLYIIPGYSGIAENHWYPWLATVMKKDGFNSKIIDFPDPSQPNINTRLEYLTKKIPEIDKNTFFVAHGLGCVTTLRYLQEINKAKKIGGYIFVAGFYGLIPDINTIPAFADLRAEELQNLADFSDFIPNYAYLTKITKNAIVIASENDEVLPFKLNMSKSLAENLEAEFHSIRQGGHFTADDGFESFPLLQQLLKNMLEENNKK